MKTTTRARVLSRLALTVFGLLAMPYQTLADVVVFVNKSTTPAAFELISAEGASRMFELDSGELLARRTVGRPRILLPTPLGPLEMQLDANACYYFADGREHQELRKIDLRSTPETQAGRDVGSGEGEPGIAVIPVKLLVDDEERAAQARWESRLRRRLERASEIFERCCGIRFEAVATGRWESSDGLFELDDALRQFKERVDPEPAWLAIGFAAQQFDDRRPMRLGSARGVLEPHILLSEWTEGVSEVERRELLVHELGHYLGAAHSPEPDSVMRPNLADGRARFRNFPIRFDAPSALAINLVAEEIQLRQVRSLSELTTGTRQRLAEIYTTLSDAFPSDPTADNLHLAVEVSELGAPVATTRHVVRAVFRAALDRPERQVDGDALTERYVRRAARAASQLGPKFASQAFVSGIGIALDDSDLLFQTPVVRAFCRQVESAEERAARLGLMGVPAMRGRHDLVQHFVVSAFLTGQFGATVADAAGLTKELADARTGSGFSFADLAADQAGILFALHVLRRKVSLEQLSERFSVTDYLPAIDDLPEGLDDQTFQTRYGGPTGEAYQQLLAQIRARIQALPVYQATAEQ